MAEEKSQQQVDMGARTEGVRRKRTAQEAGEGDESPSEDEDSEDNGKVSKRCTPLCCLK